MSDAADGRKSDRRTDKKARPRRRTGLPDPANVVAERTLRSPKGTRYRVLTTRERDPYEEER